MTHAERYQAVTEPLRFIVNDIGMVVFFGIAAAFVPIVGFMPHAPRLARAASAVH